MSRKVECPSCVDISRLCSVSCLYSCERYRSWSERLSWINPYFPDWINQYPSTCELFTIYQIDMSMSPNVIYSSIIIVIHIRVQQQSNLKESNIFINIHTRLNKRLYIILIYMYVSIGSFSKGNKIIMSYSKSPNHLKPAVIV